MVIYLYLFHLSDKGVLVFVIWSYIMYMELWKMYMICRVLRELEKDRQGVCLAHQVESRLLQMSHTHTHNDRIICSSNKK